MSYIATAMARINHADGWTSHLQLPYVEFRSPDRQHALTFAHEYYGRLAEAMIAPGAVLIDVSVSVEAL